MNFPVQFWSVIIARAFERICDSIPGRGVPNRMF